MSEHAEDREGLPDDAALRAIVAGVEAETGEQFFASLVRQLAAALRVQYAFVSEMSADRRRFRTLALWGRGAFLPSLDVPLAGTPCEAVLGGEMAHHPEHLQELFPADVALVDWGVHSYCGVPLLDAGGTVIGHLAVLDDRALRNGDRALAVMRIFTARARAEIERLRAERALRESEARLAAVVDHALDAVIIFDEAGLIQLFNPLAEKVFRCSAAEAIGTPILRFGTAGSSESIGRAIEDIRAGRKTFSISEPGLKSRRADGEEFEFEGTLAIVEVGGQRLNTITVRDLGEWRRLEAEQRRLELQSTYLQEEIKAVHNFEEIVGRSAVLQRVLSQVGLVAATDSSVLISGETGTGKELIARAIHAQSARRARPLVKVNCAALPAGLVESELFGHERGAFTGATERRSGRFELAHGGTIFLDEVGELPLDVQVKLLRVLQEREFERVGGTQTVKVDVRIIAATNRDLPKVVAAGTFRQDLYYRLNVFPVTLPALRERKDDIPPLVHYFVARYATTIGRRISRVPADTMARLAAYPWPGNVRELENVIERAVILSPGPELEVGPEVLPVSVHAPPAAPTDALPLERVERDHIVAVLRRTNWRVEGPRGAARLLSMHPNTLRSRMQKLGIRRSEEQAS